MPETVEMSFIGPMKDKTQVAEHRNVLHRANEGQNAGPRPWKCPSTLARDRENVLHWSDEGQNAGRQPLKCLS